MPDNVGPKQKQIFLKIKTRDNDGPRGGPSLSTFLFSFYSIFFFFSNFFLNFFFPFSFFSFLFLIFFFFNFFFHFFIHLFLCFFTTIFLFSVFHFIFLFLFSILRVTTMGHHTVAPSPVLLLKYWFQWKIGVIDWIYYTNTMQYMNCVCVYHFTKYDLYKIVVK